MPYHILTLPPTEEAFTWVDEATGENLHFAITQLRRFLEQCPDMTTKAMLDDASVTPEWLIESRGIELDRCAKLTTKDLRDPVIFAVMPDKSHLLIDGSHRLYRHLKNGRTWVKAFMLPEVVWREFLIVGIGRRWNKDEVLAAPTKLLMHRR